ncbi:MAG: hypothetical protein LBP62_03730 [Clostridiales bacterium]|jgi:hypothetical protein|nr:hypothetical protein [Clostridiales bacterium]
MLSANRQKKMREAYNAVFYLDWFNPRIFANADYIHEVQTLRGIALHFDALKESLALTGRRMYTMCTRDRCGYFFKTQNGNDEDVSPEYQDAIVTTPRSWSEFIANCRFDPIGSLFSMSGSFGIMSSLSGVFIMSGEREIVNKYRLNNPDYLNCRIRALNSLNLEDEIRHNEFLEFIENYFPEHIADLDEEFYSRYDYNGEYEAD